jgi:hypothetical protein
MFSLAYLHRFGRDVHDTLVSVVGELNRNLEITTGYTGVIRVPRRSADSPTQIGIQRESLIGGINSSMPFNKVRTEQEPVAETLSSQESFFQYVLGPKAELRRPTKQRSGEASRRTGL